MNKIMIFEKVLEKIGSWDFFGLCGAVKEVCYEELDIPFDEHMLKYLMEPLWKIAKKDYSKALIVEKRQPIPLEQFWFLLEEAEIRKQIVRKHIRNLKCA